MKKAIKEDNFKLIRGSVYEKVINRRHEGLYLIGFVLGVFLFIATAMIFSIASEYTTSVAIWYMNATFILWWFYIVGMKYCNQEIGVDWVKRGGEFKFKIKE